MPTVSVERDLLMEGLGRVYSEEEFDELCFAYGIELDEVTSERLEAEKAGRKITDDLSSVEIYKIDVPANRYDLLCMEGLVRALLIFLGDYQLTPTYHLTKPEQTMKVYADETKTIRPYIVCAILRGIELTPTTYQSLMDLQDQLHRNLCRQRTLVAIGTHDLDTISPSSNQLTYRALPPNDITFVPLTESNGERQWKADELLSHYETHVDCKHLKPYVPIIKDSPLYPLVSAGDTVLSLPPIINGHHSRITLNTTNMLIECTATDLTKAHVVLDTMCSMFGQYTSPIPYTIEPLTIQYYNDNHQLINSYQSPNMKTRTESATVDFVNSLIGIDIPAQQMVQLCDKLQLGPATITSDTQKGTPTLTVQVPPTRSDILHAVDIAEDIGIAYGYNNIVKRIPQTCTVGGEQPLNQLSDLLREEIARAGYMEVLTHGLCSYHDNYTAIGKVDDDDDDDKAVSLSNPANVEYQVIRTSLLTGLLKTLQHNKSSSFANGFPIFEISDVVFKDLEHVSCDSIVGARNARRVCAVYAGPTSGFEIIHGLVDRILTLCEVAPQPHYVANSTTYEDQFKISKSDWYYDIQEMNPDNNEGGDTTYFPGRSAKVLLTSPKEKEPICIGTFGILHPNVLQAFDIHYPASSLELDLDPLIT